MGAIVIVGVAAWAWAPGREPEPEGPAAVEIAATGLQNERTSPREPEPTAGEAVAELGSAFANPPAAADIAAASPEAPALVEGPPLRPRLVQPLDRRDVPSGTERAKAEAFRALPKARGDGAPLGGIGAEALHVDQLAIGSRLRAGACEGEASHFREGQHDEVHACIRVVHRRIAQQILVRWERDGRLVRRQWLPVPSTHAYRTRASLPVKRRFAGAWTVRVLSLDGAELAVKHFRVDAPRRSRASR